MTAAVTHPYHEQVARMVARHAKSASTLHLAFRYRLNNPDVCVLEVISGYVFRQTTRSYTGAMAALLHGMTPALPSDRDLRLAVVDSSCFEAALRQQRVPPWLKALRRDGQIVFRDDTPYAKHLEEQFLASR